MQKLKKRPPKLKIRRGDFVQIIAGDSKGFQGTITKMMLNKGRAIVEGANFVHKHVKPSAANPKGGIVKKEAPIHISNLMLVNPATGKPTRVGKVKNAEGKWDRIAKKSGEEIK